MYGILWIFFSLYERDILRCYFSRFQELANYALTHISAVFFWGGAFFLIRNSTRFYSLAFLSREIIRKCIFSRTTAPVNFQTISSNVLYSRLRVFLQTHRQTARGSCIGNSSRINQVLSYPENRIAQSEKSVVLRKWDTKATLARFCKFRRSNWRAACCRERYSRFWSTKKKKKKQIIIIKHT